MTHPLDSTLAGDRRELDARQVAFDRRLRSVHRAEFGRLDDEMRRTLIRHVWTQVDRAAPMTALETARFVLRRLYPELEGPRLESIMRRLGDEFAAGTWAGFIRRGR
jgi:hypothetical protein